MDLQGHEGRPRRTAQIVKVCSPGKGHWASLIEDLYLNAGQPLVDGGEPRLLRVEVSDVAREGMDCPARQSRCGYGPDRRPLLHGPAST